MSLNWNNGPGAGVRMPSLFERYRSEAASFLQDPRLAAGTWRNLFD